MKKTFTEEQAAVRGGIQKRTKLGTYTVVISLIVLAVLIVINLLVSALPSKWTVLDTSTNKLYTISESSERAVHKLKENATIYYIRDSSQSVDTQMETYLSRFAAINSRITLKAIDPVTQPGFTSQYTEETLSNYSLIIESAKRYRVIDYYDMFYYEGGISASDSETLSYYYMMYGELPNLYFNGENQIVSALDYVTTDDIPTAYMLTGHNESALSSTLQTQLLNSNINLTGSLSLLTLTAVPENCDLLIVNAPTVDLNGEEAQMIITYLQTGGKLFLITSPGIADQPNLLSVAESCGLTATDGIVIEGDSNHYYPQYPYYLLPEVESHDITSELISSYYVIMPFAHGITRAETVPSGITIAPLFSTTSSAYTVDVKATGVTRTDESVGGTFWVGATAQNENGGKLVWISSAAAMTDVANNITGANYTYFSAMTTWLCPRDTILSTVAATSMEDPMLVVTESATLIWSAVFILIIPLCFIVTGLVIWIRRRRR